MPDEQSSRTPGSPDAPPESTYEGLRAELKEAIERQERILAGMAEELEDAGHHGLTPGEPALRHMSEDYERAGEYLDMLNGYSADLADRERRGVPLGDPRTDVFVEGLLEVLD